MAARLADKQAILSLSPDNPRPVAKKPVDPGPAWWPSRALGRAGMVVGVALLVAVALGRPDFLVIAVPFVLGSIASLAVRPRSLPTAELRLDTERLSEGEEARAGIVIHNPDPVPMTCSVTAEAGPWLRLHHGVGRFIRELPADHDTEVALAGITTRWGPHAMGPARVHAIACDGLLVSRRLLLPSKPVRVYPSTDLFDSRQALPQAAGMAGIHRSRRLGDGGELAEVRHFQPGDRLRRIDWRVSLRNRDLYVNATLSERDADVVVLLDVLHDAGNEPGNGTAGILDVTVRAAAAIAEHYAHQGDRVAMVEFGPQMRRMRPGSGRRHYMTTLEWLVDTRVLPGGLVSVDRMVSGGAIPSGSVVIMLTPLIDERSTEGLAALARSGRSLITVDTLPPAIQPPWRSSWTPTAARLWRLNRDNTLGRLGELGVPVESWRGPGSLDLMLADVARLGRAPRMTGRGAAAPGQGAR